MINSFVHSVCALLLCTEGWCQTPGSKSLHWLRQTCVAPLRPQSHWTNSPIQPCNSGFIEFASVTAPNSTSQKLLNSGCADSGGRGCPNQRHSSPFKICAGRVRRPLQEVGIIGIYPGDFGSAGILMACSQHRFFLKVVFEWRNETPFWAYNTRSFYWCVK